MSIPVAVTGTVSEFTTTVFGWKGSNGSREDTTWRWLPHDPRAQHLYRDGGLPSSIAEQFLQSVESASIWIAEQNTVVFSEVEGSRLATIDERVDVLDGWLWVSRNLHGDPIFEAVEESTDAWWAGHRRDLRPGFTLLNESAWTARFDKRNAAFAARGPSSTVLEIVASRQAEWDAKALRYKKLGWDDDDVTAEFGPRPEVPA